MSLLAPNRTTDLRQWATEAAQSAFGPKPCTLLAQADDGYVWGAWTGQALGLTEDVPSLGCARRLRSETLQWLRLFGREDDLRVWRHSDGFRLARETELSRSGGDELPIERSFLLVGAAVRAPGALPGHLEIHDHPRLDLKFTQLSGVARQLHAPPGRWSTPPSLRTCLIHRRESDSGQWLLHRTRFVELAVEDSQ